MEDRTRGEDRTWEAAELMGERETTYFGVSPYNLMDRIGEFIVEAYAHLESRLPQSLSAACPFLTNAQAQAITQAWLSQVESAVDRNFELFETYCLRNVFKLPSEWLLDYETYHNSSNADAEGFDRLLDGLKNAKVEQLKLEEYQRQIGTQLSLDL